MTKRINYPKIRKVKHGMYASREYKAWIMMKQRCYNTNYPKYYMHGGRGIKVCERWNDFQNFFADMGPRPENTTLDRIDNNEGYNPKNCRWADRFTQMRNTRRNVYITIYGTTKSRSEWAELLGIHSTTLGVRLKRWSFERAFYPLIIDVLDDEVYYEQ